MSDYDGTRRPEHSTMGDAHERFLRDEDAFTAGVQYALDRMLGQADATVRLINPRLADLLDSTAASVLGRVHEGALT